MEKVAQDKGGAWHYLPATDQKKAQYVCLSNKGDMVGRLYPEFVPDPDVIWEQKCAFEEVEPNSHKGRLLKPNPVVYKLWEHVNANADT